MTDRASFLNSLSSGMSHENGAGIDDRTRAVLSLLAQVRAAPGRQSADATACPNCGSPCDDLRSPYCSAACREMAAFVRQLRAALDSGAIQDPERQVALGQKLWHLLGGGFPRRMPLIPARVIRQVIAREDGSCQGCGAPAVTVDHPGSG